ncbi:MAG TPA: MmgE/PrpD family protein [Burkholderiales bacterium]|nr:MmgE/PrpD family protein [Burkholderiales bacterium]
MKQDVISPVMRRLSAYIARAPNRALPGPVAEKTKHHILDTIAAMVSGSRLLPGRKAISYVKTLGGTKEACVVGSRLIASAANAALANGMCAHADETDDSHAPSVMHPGCGIVPAALAVAEKEGRNGEALLRAVALGYDVATRLTMSLNAFKLREDGLSTHSYGPTFGAAAAAGMIARVNEKQARYLLSYAAQQASGISCWMRDAEHIEKAFDFGGMPARNGVTAATMVAQGFSGVEDVFSGERNFFAAHGRPADPEALVRGLGEDYEILRTNIKRWSVGSPIQAPLDSLAILIQQHGVKADQVEKVVIRVAHRDKNTTDNRPMPDICMQHLCALMLLDGAVTFKSSHDEKRFRDREVLEFRRKIDLQGDDALTKTMPARQGIVEITLRDGRSLRHHTVAVRGTAENPMSRAEVDAKCCDLIAPVAGKARARKLCDAVWNLDKLADVRRLRPLLQEKS